MEEFRTAYDLPVMPLDEFLVAIKKLPKVDEVIQGILPRNQVMLIAGDPWQGKSLETQRLACAFGAKGADFHGLKVMKCQALYLTWEGATEGIGDRFSSIIKYLKPDIMPLLKLAPEPMPLNKPAGYSKFYELLEAQKKGRNLEVVLVDSFPYIFKGNPRQDEDIQAWWEALQRVALALELTFIIVWELTKIVFAGQTEPEIFNIERLKTAHTTAYKVNTVVAIGELKRNVRAEGVIRWASLGHRIVVLKAKDAKGNFEPLKVVLDRNSLCWNGQHWTWDNSSNLWKAMSDE